MKKIFFLVMLFVLFICAKSFAQENIVIDKSLDVIESMGQTHSDEETGKIQPEIRYDFDLGLEYTYFTYKEPSINVKETTNFYGVTAGATGHSKSTSLMGRVEGKFAAGPVNYDGQLNNGTPWKDDGKDYIFEGRALMGRDFEMGKSTTVTPIFGFGFRYLNDKLDSQYAYEREISYLYSPIGFEAGTSLGNDWKIALNAEYDIFWSGIVRSHLSDVNSAFNDLRNKQDTGYGARVSVALQRKLSGSMLISIEPFFRYWNIKQSDNANVTVGGTIVGYGFEPANRTSEYGLRLSLIW